MKRFMLLGAAAGVLTLLQTVPAEAQLNGSHSLGDFGVQSGSQPLPGIYAALFYYRSDTDTIKDADGNKSGLSPSEPSSIAHHGHRSDPVVRQQGQGPRWELRSDGGVSVRERVARGAGVRVGQ